ncbi:MAG: CHAT domain-containing protein, partial [Aliifodinibius sp.]|nr:CHAT domain-containing protein [Fodinibius sp.]NIV69644.1 CHAT domain-containing protein [Phycisphaerae bacterium]NIY25910.1 CHAT domain-containing protein [Fodinibius sp.]
WVNSLLPFKSVFRGARFESLPYAELEVRTIAENFEKATVVIGREASERKFKEGAQNYRFIHLATHNITDDKQPMYSKIILAQTDDKNEDGFLQTYEVYNLRLNAELVVLSGCNTGLGRLSRGEGLIGVTRAFLYAGAPSLVVSLWPVNDESTAELMKYFYRNLKADMAKNQ